MNRPDRTILAAVAVLAGCGDPATPAAGSDATTASASDVDDGGSAAPVGTDGTPGPDGGSDAPDPTCSAPCTCAVTCDAGTVSVRGTADPDACGNDGTCPSEVQFACPGACAEASVDPADACARADAILAGGDALELCAPVACPDPYGDGDVLYDQSYGPEDRQWFDLYLPDGAPTPLPVFVWIHGGAWLEGDKSEVPGPIVDMRRRGVAVMAITYRFSDTPFPTTISDVRAAIRWIHEHGDELGLDGDRIGVAGDSAGGHLANILGAAADVGELDLEPGGTPPSVVLAVPFYGPSELLTMDGDAIDNGCGPDGTYHDAHGSPEAELVDCDGDLPDCAEIATLASPLTHVDAGDPPFVIVHGSADCTVPTPQGRRMHETLQAAGVEAGYFETPGAGHSFDEVANDENLGAIGEAIDRHLLHCTPQ